MGQVMDKYLGRVCAGVLVVVLASLAIHTPATIWIGTMLGDNMDVIIKAWKEVLLIGIAPLVLWLAVRDDKLRSKLAHDKLLWLIAGYALLHMVMLLVFWQGWWQGISGLLIDLRYLLAFTMVYVIVMASPATRRWLLGAIIAGAVIIIGFATIQHALPYDALKAIGYGPNTVVPYLTVDQNYDYIRLSSTMRGPNPMGAYAASVVLIVIALAWGRRLVGSRQQIFAGVMAVLAAVALWFSYSRSAKLALIAGLVALGVIYRPWEKFSRRTLAAVSASGLVVLVAASALLWQSTWFSNVVLHTNPEDGSVTQSNAEHWESLVVGTERLLTQPLGAGVGSTGSASLFGDQPLIIENQYLFIAHEVGWLGLGLFLAIFGLVLIRLYGISREDAWAAGALASGVGLAFVGMVLPVWVDDVVSILWWSLATIVLAAGSGYTGKHAAKKPVTRHQKTARNT